MVNMPVLEPVPILTKNKNFFVAIWRWVVYIRKWKVVEDWRYTLKDGTEVIIRKEDNFVFDGASIPKPFWFLLSPTGLLLIPGLLHDYAYKHDRLVRYNEGEEVNYYNLGVGRRFWDRMFRDEAIIVNDFRIINYIAWIALWLFGFLAWWSHHGKKSKQSRKQRQTKRKSLTVSEL